MFWGYVTPSRRFFCVALLALQGKFHDETVAVEVASRKGPAIIIDRDEEYTNVSVGPKPDREIPPCTALENPGVERGDMGWDCNG